MFYCKRVGAFSRDYEVYRDEACEEEKWMVIDTEGSIFDDNAYITVRAPALRAALLRPMGAQGASGRDASTSVHARVRVSSSGRRVGPRGARASSPVGRSSRQCAGRAQRTTRARPRLPRLPRFLKAQRVGGAGTKKKRARPGSYCILL